jgi:hypothetical protein
VPGDFVTVQNVVDVVEGTVRDDATDRIAAG